MSIYTAILALKDMIGTLSQRQIPFSDKETADQRAENFFRPPTDTEPDAADRERPATVRKTIQARPGGRT
ncbi:hypothetical protein LWF15_09190 [Kineosporia rhizophila]|uniref:hypothetical protein n=1 Tax=Kineosporia TaxID=49184 RepID=UPI001E4FEAFA|nr:MULTISPECIES: hypothetical protein [Kineosporia]MCE0535686.1 hypothetical protein [Kineosporia rhizophila]GLY17668.1 hypothetical protein Kisp01_46820 [Kineosporia sp. NBRC 101677]